MSTVVVPNLHTFDGKRAVPNAAVRKVMLDALELKPGDKLLEIGTGSGTQTRDFAGPGVEVHSIELQPWVDSTVIVGECVFLHSGDGINGLPQEAPFTAIVATCGMTQIPRAWQEQLADGGRIIVPIGDTRSQKLCLLRKNKGELLAGRVLAYVRFQMMKHRPEHKLTKPVYKS